MNADIEIREAQVVDVSYPKRMVTVVVHPYETPTTIYTRSGSFTEIVSQGAYHGAQRRRIRANRDHSWARLVGKVTDLYTDRQEGLVADVRMFEHGEGPATLELCAEDGLSASAGFTLMREDNGRGPVKPNAEEWTDNRKVRRLNDLYLDHVAFVPDPAYETANVIDVRQGILSMHEVIEHERMERLAVTTPNRDRLALEQLRAQMAEINGRYGV
jgi:hypothetical protein